MNDVDEEVVLQGSQLHKYLEEQGLSGYEIAVNTVPSCKSIKLPAAAKHKHWSIFSYFKTASAKERQCLYNEVKIILKSGLLFPEDCDMVVCLIPKLEENKREKSSWLENITAQCTVVSGSFYLWYRQIVPLIIPAIISCCSGCFWVHKQLDTWCTLERVKKIKDMLNSQMNFSILLKKIMKLVKELEIFDRQLSLTTIGHSRITEDSPMLLFAKPKHTVPQLRTALASTSVDIIKILIDAIQYMVLSFPINLSCDSHSNYIAFLSEKDMGLANSLHEGEHVEWTLTDLQKLHDTFLLLQSEFLRRLCMCFSEDLCPESFARMPEILYTCQTLNKKFLSLSEVLTKEYKMYNSYNGNEESENKGKTDSKDCEWQYSNIYASVHNVSLHLQCLLHRNQKLEELLQDMHGKKNTEEHFLWELQNSVSIINKQLDLCKSSVNEIAVQIKNLLNKPADNYELQKSLIEANPSEPQIQNSIPIIVGHSEWDPPGEDEVFEALISHDSHRHYEFEQDLNTEDIMGIKSKRLFSEKVLMELKGALVVKREEWKVREENALRKKTLKENATTKLQEYNEHQPLNRCNNCMKETNMGQAVCLDSCNTVVNKNCEFRKTICAEIQLKEPLLEVDQAGRVSIFSKTSIVTSAPETEKTVKTFLAEAPPKAILSGFLKEDLFSGDGESYSENETEVLSDSEEMCKRAFN